MLGKLPIVLCLGFSWRDIPNRLQQPVMVEPVHPFQRRLLDCLALLAGCTAMAQFCLVQAVDGFGQCIDAPMSSGSRFGQISEDQGIQFSNEISLQASLDFLVRHTLCSPTARFMTSGENLVALFIAPSSQKMGPPSHPGRFTDNPCVQCGMRSKTQNKVPCRWQFRA